MKYTPRGAQAAEVVEVGQISYDDAPPHCFATSMLFIDKNIGIIGQWCG